MRDYQRELEELRERIARRREDAGVLNELRWQVSAQSREVEDRRARLREEERDVDRLERLTLSSVLAALKGDKGQRIDQERAEAYAARLRLQEAERRLEEIQAEIAEREERIRKNADCEERYAALLREKETELRRADPALAAKLADLERRELEMTVRQKELREAISAGETALASMDEALDRLGSAENWGLWDLMSDGILGDIMKYSRLDEAQAHIEQLKDDLRRYQAELADVALVRDFDVRPGEWMQFADVFFDNIFTDWMVQSHIEKSPGGAARCLGAGARHTADAGAGLAAGGERADSPADGAGRAGPAGVRERSRYGGLLREILCGLRMAGAAGLPRLSDGAGTGLFRGLRHCRLLPGEGPCRLRHLRPGGGLL